LEKDVTRLYGIPNCDQIRKAKRFLQSHRVDFEFINIRKAPLSREKLKAAVRQLGMDRVINKRGATYRKLGIKDRALNDDQLFDILLDEQTLIKRPLIENRGSYLSGYDEAKIEQLIYAHQGQ